MPDGPRGFQRQGPASISPLTWAVEPILVDKSLFAPGTVADNTADHEVSKATGLELVPWKPVGAVIAMHIVAEYIDYRRGATLISSTAIQSQPAIILPGPMACGPKIQTPLEQPSPMESPPRHRRVDRPPKSKSTNLSNTSLSSGSVQSTPLVEASVRRSPRIRGDKDGFKHVHLGKRQRRKVPILSIPALEGQTGPILVEILQSWGISCRVAPEDISDEALMQTPSTSSPNISDD